MPADWHSLGKRFSQHPPLIRNNVSCSQAENTYTAAWLQVSVQSALATDAHTAIASMVLRVGLTLIMVKLLI